MKTRDILKLIEPAYSRLHCLNDISLTKYRDRCYDMAVAEERGHRRGAPDGHEWPAGASVNAAGRFFVVNRIAQYISGYPMPTIGDVLSFQESAIYAAAIVANYRAEIVKAWVPLATNSQPIALTFAQYCQQLAALDYCTFVGSN